MDMEDEVRQKAGREADGKIVRAIRFEDVSFSYENAEDSPVVLHDINLEVKAGEVLAVVGSKRRGQEHSGAPHPALF